MKLASRNPQISAILLSLITGATQNQILPKRDLFSSIQNFFNLATKIPQKNLLFTKSMNCEEKKPIDNQ